VIRQYRQLIDQGNSTTSEAIAEARFASADRLAAEHGLTPDETGRVST
jgi:hypothetical protein